MTLKLLYVGPSHRRLKQGCSLCWRDNWYTCVEFGDLKIHEDGNSPERNMHIFGFTNPSAQQVLIKMLKGM